MESSKEKETYTGSDGRLLPINDEEVLPPTMEEIENKKGKTGFVLGKSYPIEKTL